MLSRVKGKGKTDQDVYLADLRLKRRRIGKSAYIIRVKNVMKTEKSQAVAMNFARRFRTACQQVLKRGGAAADN